MNMMPRWDEGFGFQIVQEYRHESALLDGKTEVGNGLSETAHLTHLEGVYTWDRSIRLTFKLPYVIDAERELLDHLGNVYTQSYQGLGDLTLALPLKHYFNEYGASGSWTFAPQIRVPLGERKPNEYSIPDRVWGLGLSFGYERETPLTFINTGLGIWLFETSEPNEVSANLDLGWNFHTRGQLLLETDLLMDSDGARTLSTGTALYWRVTDLVHTRAEIKWDIYDDQGNRELDHGNGYTAKIGLGFVW